jgi:hypothetical protein
VFHGGPVGKRETGGCNKFGEGATSSVPKTGQVQHVCRNLHEIGFEFAFVPNFQLNALPLSVLFSGCKIRRENLWLVVGGWLQIHQPQVLPSYFAARKKNPASSPSRRPIKAY